MLCPNCGHDKLKVADTEPKDGNIIERLRKCKRCGFGWTTIETEKFKESHQENQRI